MLFDHPEYDQHVQVSFVSDAATGLRAVNAIHLLRRGTSGGGIRFRPYASDDDALTDVLRLSRAMTYKMVLSGLPIGGAKTVIVGDPARDKSPELLRAVGRFVDSLDGRYTCGPDVGTNEHDMDVIGQVTSHVAGRSDRSGSTAPPTALGVFHGIRATAQVVFGDSDLRGRRVAVQGVGGVGAALLPHLLAAGAEVIVADVDPAAVEAIVAEYGVSAVDPAEVLFADVDIVSPNAIGGILDEEAIARLRAPSICGSANNQLADSGCGELLAARGIAWAPDYVVSSGGAIAGTCEVGAITPDERDRKLAAIFDTTVSILGVAMSDGVSADAVAQGLAQDLLAAER